jgi:PQQ-dependent dehydrogenase (methanol/ethanol family)
MSAPAGINPVDGQRIQAANKTPGEWLTTGRTWSEQRFSPLKTVSDQNVSGLSLAWYYDLPHSRGVEATPLIADGVMYTTGSWSVVFAFDAKTGELLWQYDPKVPGEKARDACCDVVNRGVALWGDKVYVGTIDGRLVALDRATGEEAWVADTLINQEDPYTITGAPRVVNGKVIIGNGGAEMGVRGYVTAYDADTGKQIWRFYTVPGNPADGFESMTQEMIAQTWTGQWWENGKGGGTAWDSFAFDPELNLLYIGVGNGSTWNHKIRSPQGGDNLFLSSIVAVDADTGDYIWHYQTTPGDTWDFTATQHMILAELDIDGEQRKVLMQAPKNGFFYVLDRTNGELLSANNYMPTTWATHIDMETGRPVETPRARSGDPAFVIKPASVGAHTWHPMTYSPNTGFVYIPAMSNEARYLEDHFTARRKTSINLNYDMGTMLALPDELTIEERKKIASGLQAQLIAWDPVKNEEVWRKPGGAYSGSGLLSTAGNLLFQGDLEGNFSAYAADTGEKLWSQYVQGGVMAAPVTYVLEGQQYVAVMQGWGGDSGMAAGAITSNFGIRNASRVLVYKLGGQASLPVPPDLAEKALPAPTLAGGTAEQVEEGRTLYNLYCIACHGGNATSAGIIPDLRFRIDAIAPAWQAIVMEGGLKTNGMPGWKDFMTAEEAEAIKAYVVHEAKQGHARGEKRLVTAEG